MEPDIIHALPRRNLCQIIGARRNERGPVGTGVAQRKIIEIEYEYQHETGDEPQDRQDHTLSGKKYVGEVQVGHCQENPVEPLEECRCVLAYGHSNLVSGFPRSLMPESPSWRCIPWIP